MACFPALNTLKTKVITLINAPAHKVVKKPIVIINSVRRGGGTKDMQEIKQRGKGVSFHPRLLVNAMPYSKVSINQSLVDFFNGEVDEDKKAQDNPAFYKDETFLPKFYNTITHLNQRHGVLWKKFIRVRRTMFCAVFIFNWTFSEKTKI